LKYKLICETPINVIGFEYAGNPSYLDLLDRKVLEDSNTYVGIGISRTDIFSLISIINEKYGINAWKQKKYMQKIITELETPDAIKKRLEPAFSILGDCIKYANPTSGWLSGQIRILLLSCSRILQKVSTNLMQKERIKRVFGK
jgi:5-methyltetrahydropteroyltriglutamate--homocysteine methyltransferase